MDTIRVHYREKEKNGFIDIKVLKDHKIYIKDFYLDKITKLSAFDAQCLANRIKWADSHGLGKAIIACWEP